jgi:cytochrome c oxidase subunit II
VEAQLVAAGYAREQFLLATDTSVVVPVGKTVVMQVTAADVIHSWKIPAFGVMQDAVPGRLASLWFKAEQEGIYFGQCSELCGQMHAYMPITVKVVSEEVYADWLAANKLAAVTDGILDGANFVEPEDLMVAGIEGAPATDLAANE